MKNYKITLIQYVVNALAVDLKQLRVAVAEGLKTFVFMHNVNALSGDYLTAVNNYLNINVLLMRLKACVSAVLCFVSHDICKNAVGKVVSSVFNIFAKNFKAEVICFFGKFSDFFIFCVHVYHLSDIKLSVCLPIPLQGERQAFLRQ